MTVTSRGSDQFVMRFPDGMRAEIKARAKASGRSMNSEIIMILSKALGRHYEPDSNEPSDDEGDDDLVEILACALDEWEQLNGPITDPDSQHWSVAARRALKKKGRLP